MKNLVFKIQFLSKPVALLLLVLAGYVANAQPPANMSKLAVQLLLNTNGGSQNMADGFMVAFDSSFSSVVGPEDSRKFANMDENISINRNGTFLSIECRATISDYDTVPIRIWKYRQTSYCLKFDASKFSNSVVAVLKHNYLHTDIPIDLTRTTMMPYTLTADSASYSPDRLCIVFKPASTSPLGITSIKLYQKQTGRQVGWRSEGGLNVEKYAVERSANSEVFTGMADMHPTAFAADNYSWYDAHPAEGNNYYRIKIVAKSGSITYNAVAKMNTYTNSSITVYPNPVTGNKIGLQLRNIDKGDYKVSLYNSNGQNIFTSFFQHSGESSHQSVNIKKDISRGVYLMNIQNGETIISKQVAFQ